MDTQNHRSRNCITEPPPTCSKGITWGGTQSVTRGGVEDRRNSSGSAFIEGVVTVPLLILILFGFVDIIRAGFKTGALQYTVTMAWPSTMV